MELNPDWFNDQLDQMGQNVSWRRALACPCRDTHSGAARLGCPTCAGKGQFWPFPAVRCRTGLAGMKVARAFQQFGTWEDGDCIFTIPSDSPLYAIGEYDRALMLDSSEPFSEVLTRGELDRVFGQVQSIEAVIYLPTPTAAPVFASRPSWDADGNLSWAAGAPPDGAQYTVRGRKRQEYYMFKELPQDRAHFGGLQLPRRVQMRRLDLFLR